MDKRKEKVDGKEMMGSGFRKWRDKVQNKEVRNCEGLILI